MLLQQYKIVFCGSMGAGKSTAIQTISDIEVVQTEAVNTDVKKHEKSLTTVGIDYGEIKLEDDTIVGLYGTPGQDRFDFLWSVVCKGAIGLCLLIDHSQKNNRLRDLATYLERFKNYNNNIVIGITHTDQHDDQILKIYRDWMQLNDYSYPIFAIDSRKKTDVLLMIEILIATVEFSSHQNT